MDCVLRVVGRLLMQLNVPERFMNLAVDPKPRTCKDEQKEKLEKFILPKTDSLAVECALTFGPT